MNPIPQSQWVEKLWLTETLIGRKNAVQPSPLLPFHKIYFVIEPDGTAGTWLAQCEIIFKFRGSPTVVLPAEFSSTTYPGRKRCVFPFSTNSATITNESISLAGWSSTLFLFPRLVVAAADDVDLNVKAWSNTGSGAATSWRAYLALQSSNLRY